MCELATTATGQTRKKERRLKLWEIRPDMHCSIIGTCLGHSDLLRIGRKNGYAPDANATEYHVHSFFVQCAEEKSRLSRQLHKALDTRYRVAILASNAAQNEEDLNAFWSDAFAGGDIAGAWCPASVTRRSL